jgi:hypothetical protein
MLLSLQMLPFFDKVDFVDRQQLFWFSHMRSHFQQQQRWRRPLRWLGRWELWRRRRATDLSSSLQLAAVGERALGQPFADRQILCRSPNLSRPAVWVTAKGHLLRAGAHFA